ncbi:MAG: COQ9 family protein [Alphaproteobacteria bacterium]|nr:COQ9 family protein [Alphaproteobacteria bacterium]
MTRTDTQKIWLEAILAEIPFTGWGAAAIAAASEALAQKNSHVTGDESSFARVFPGGLACVMRFWNHSLDQAMTAELQRIIASAAAQQPPRKIGVSEKIKLAVKTRLELMTPHRLAAQRGSQKFALLNGQILAKTIDEIWGTVGDTSSDFNWYTKRASLLAIYSATALFWLHDESEGQQETWQFLDRRLQDLADFHRNKSKVQKTVSDGFAQIFTKRVTCPILRPRSLSVLP